MTASTRLYFYWFTLDLLVVYIRLILIYKNIIAKLWMLRPHSLLSYLFLLRCVLKARYKRKWPSLLVVMETSGPRRNNLKPVIESDQSLLPVVQILSPSHRSDSWVFHGVSSYDWKKECSRSEKTRRRLFTSLSPNLFKAATYRDLVLGQHWHPRLLDLLGTLKRFHERQMDFEL